MEFTTPISGNIPLPVFHFRHIVAVLSNIFFVIEQFIAEVLLHVRGAGAQLRNAIDYIAHQVKSIEIIQHDHVERSCRRAFFFVSADVDVVVIVSAIGKSMNQPRIPVDRQR